MMKRLLVGFLLGILATIGLAAQTKIAVCPQSGALNVYVSMGAGGCNVGALTFSNFASSYSQTINGTTTTTAPSSYNLSPYTGTNGTGLAVDAPLQAGNDDLCIGGLVNEEQCLAAQIQQQTFTLTFNVSPNNGTAINGLGIIFGNFGLGSHASAGVSIPGSASLGVGCQQIANLGQACEPQLDGCSYCPASALHENFPPIPSANVTIGEQAYEDFGGGYVRPLAVTLDQTPVITPEPATWLLFGTGLLLMLGLAVRARRKERFAG